MIRTSQIVAIFLLLASGQILSAQTAPSTPSQNIYIGFIDDAREGMSNGQSGVAPQRLIRIGFEKTGAEWQTVPRSEALPSIIWTATYNGRSLGTVQGEATDPAADQSSRKSLTLTQRIASPISSIPTIGMPSKTFAGAASDAAYFRRPLVVVSQPNFSDPDGWKRLPEIANTVIKTLSTGFRQEFPRAERCEYGLTVEKNWKFPDSAYKFTAVYTSNKKSYLVEVHVDAGECNVMETSTDPRTSQWFFISETGEVRRIGAFMKMLDAGDYDQDGRSEIIFFRSQPYEDDGFILYDSKLNKLASLTWTH